MPGQDFGCICATKGRECANDLSNRYCLINILDYYSLTQSIRNVGKCASKTHKPEDIQLFYGNPDDGIGPLDSRKDTSKLARLAPSVRSPLASLHCLRLT